MELLYPTDGYEVGDEKGAEKTVLELRRGIRLKFAVAHHAQRGYVAKLSWGDNHDDIARSLLAELGDATFEGAGFAGKAVVVWGSPNCMSIFTKDRPKSVGQQSRIGSEILVAIQRLLSTA